jgi:AcrR family transcriptional regulator
MPISDCEVRDPRIRRTRQLLQGALRTLMQTKSFDEIAVQDITEAATVNRATFYDHYTDKYALLEAMVAGGFHMLLHQRNVSYDGTCPSAASAIILATCDYLTQTHPGGAVCERQSAFEPLSEAAITAAIRRTIMGGVPQAGSETSSSAPSPEMIATAASWAIYGAVKEWFRSANRPPVEEIVPLVLQLVLPILQAAGPMGTADQPMATLAIQH